MADRKLGTAALCPECDAELRFKSLPTRGQLLTCHRCHTRLIVVERSPIELDWAANSEAHTMGDSTRSKKRRRLRRRDADDWEQDSF